MRKTINRFIIFVYISVTVLFFSGCGKETIIIPATSFNYFPVEKGKWVEYIVDSTYHSENDNGNDDSVYSYHFEIREEIDSSYTDDSGRINQIIKRYRRYNPASSWSLTNIWTQSLSTSSAYRTEDNITYHKLSFPINSTIMWNGNDANTFDEELYYYDYFHEPAIYNSLSFDSTISIIQVDENNYVEKVYGREVYAAGVGLIFKERDELGKLNGIAVKGLEYKMLVKDFGFN